LIQERLRESEPGRGHRVRVERAVRVGDLSRLLLSSDPLIVHFSGHGNKSGEMIFEDDNGRAQPVTPEALAGLFTAVRGRIECVVLNACYTMERADALLSSAKCVIGMTRAFDDESAQRFSAGFYRGLAFGKDYHSAFEIGRNEIALLELPGPDVPHFLTRDWQILESTSALSRVTRTARPSTVDNVTRVVGDKLTTTAIIGGIGDLLWNVTRVVGDKLTTGNKTPLYPLWFGTNRKPVDPGNLAKGFSGERDSQIHFGTCSVAVPKSHQIGSVGSSWWQRLLTWNDDRLKVDWASLRELSDMLFWENVQQALRERGEGERRALVFLHGYNVSFEGAALRAAQIGYDLQVPGMTAFYSWPSRGSYVGYPADEASIEASESQIATFLIQFVRQSGAERVDLVAHSMGNRALLRSMQRIIQEANQLDSGRVPFGQILLAAPDVDADVFRQLAGIYAQAAQRTTLYVSSRDMALASSGIVHGSPRAGYKPPVTVVPAIDTVEVSNIDLTFLGHGYFAEARDLLHDMHALLEYNAAPEKRLGLRPARTDDGEAYWIIGK
jgi:esterase/lipase superfamily enzyme